MYGAVCARAAQELGKPEVRRLNKLCLCEVVTPLVDFGQRDALTQS